MMGSLTDMFKPFSKRFEHTLSKCIPLEHEGGCIQKHKMQSSNLKQRHCWESFMEVISISSIILK